MRYTKRNVTPLYFFQSHDGVTAMSRWRSQSAQIDYKRTTQKRQKQMKFNIWDGNVHSPNP
ncbi:hypothetical protein GNF11_00910 [Nostoc sp. UCD122]|uniref:hypothetical protein n=1 Tax=Nostoc sp. UCD120 TaxID=2681312 RepID=UPI001625BA34|nr:hypothetical protein [Nostoc sp. UCD120]MBC1220793.1 hypothetical protein [Nostoc sp. UCD120]MBC1293574.1 hypothetical protein [Nostoc sp. UCD122]